MREITIPEPIQLYDLSTGKPILKSDDDPTPEDPWTIFKFIARFVFPDPKIGKGKKGAKTVSRLTKKFRDATPGSKVLIDDEDWHAVLDVLDDPSGPWPQMLAGQMISFVEAFSTENTTEK